MDIRKLVNPEEHEYLLEFIDGPAYKVVIEKVLPALLKQEADKVLAIRPDTEADVHKLAIQQASYQGSRVIIEHMKALKNALRNQRT